jgi:hypothetical protein
VNKLFAIILKASSSGLAKTLRKQKKKLKMKNEGKRAEGNESGKKGRWKKNFIFHISKFGREAKNLAWNFFVVFYFLRV